MIDLYRWTRDILAPRLLVALFARRAPWVSALGFHLFDCRGNRWRDRLEQQVYGQRDQDGERL